MPAAGLDLTAAARALLEAGSAILQLRHKQVYTGRLFNAASEIAEMCRAFKAKLVINDRADIAALLGAALHIGQDDLLPADARRVIGEQQVLGLSTHNEQQLRDALTEPVDYLAFGPIFSTASKVNPDPVAGLAELSRLRPLANRPLVAIGGITRARSDAVLQAGADSIAVIADLYPEPLTAASLEQRAREWIRVTSTQA